MTRTPEAKERKRQYNADRYRRLHPVVKRRKRTVHEDGPAAVCEVGSKEYRLRHRLWRDYRITLEEFDEMVKAQNGVCAICENPPPEGERLCVDHCHDLNVVRGLLCHLCNTALGKFKDSPALLMKAASYVRAGLTAGQARK